MERRAFIGLAAAGYLGACASLAVTPVTPSGGRVRLALRNYPALQRPGGFLKVRPTGTDTTLYVLALPDDRFATVSPICKHLGCTVGIERDVLVCPCHGSMYDRQGRVLRGPTEAPLDRYPTTLSADGVLTIDVETP